MIKLLILIYPQKENSNWGYIVEADLEFTEELHEYLIDYPPALSKELVHFSDLSTSQVQMLGNIGITSLPKLPKLNKSLQTKEVCLLYYLTFRLYVQIEVKITLINRMLRISRKCMVCKRNRKKFCLI